MTQQTIHNLLRRKRLKGDEVGGALLASLAWDFGDSGNPEHTPLLTQQELRQLVALLPSDYERGRYDEYARIHMLLLGMLREVEGMLQQLQHGMHRLIIIAVMAESVRQLQQRVAPLADVDPRLSGDIHRIFEVDYPGVLETPALQQELLDANLRLVRPAYRYLLGHNQAIDILIEGLSLPDIAGMKVPLEEYLTEGTQYDAMMAQRLAELPEELGGPLRAYFLPLRLERIQPDPARVEAYLAEVRERGPAGCDPELYRDTVVPPLEEVS